MLTESEEKWLNDREIYLAGLGHYIWDSYYWDEALPFEDMKEAAEFEARVAARLASYNASTMDWMSNVISPACWETCRGRRFCEEGNLSCAEATLAAARLAVEAEMDGQHRSMP